VTISYSRVFKRSPFKPRLLASLAKLARENKPCVSFRETLSNGALATDAPTVRGTGLALQGSIPWHVPHALSRSRPTSNPRSSSQDRLVGRRRGHRDALLDDEGDVNLLGPRQSYSAGTQVCNGSVRPAPKRTAEQWTQPRTDLCQLLFSVVGGARRGQYFRPAPHRWPPPALAWVWTPFLTTHRRAGASTASSPCGPTSGRTALRRVGRGRGRLRRPPPTCQRCTTCSRRVSTSIWSRTPMTGRLPCGCGCPSFLSCTVVAERWAFHTALARAPRSRTRGTCSHPCSHPYSHNSHPCSHPCAHRLQVHLYASTHGTTVLGTLPARERRAHATLVLRAPQHDVYHSAQSH